MQLPLLFLGAILPFTLAAPVEVGTEIAARGENQDVAIAAPKTSPEENHILVSRANGSRRVRAPSALLGTTKFLVDSILYTVTYVGKNKYVVTASNALTAAVHAYVSDDALLGLDVWSERVPAQGYTTNTMEGVSPGEQLTLSWTTTP